MIFLSFLSSPNCQPFKFPLSYYTSSAYRKESSKGICILIYIEHLPSALALCKCYMSVISIFTLIFTGLVVFNHYPHLQIWKQASINSGISPRSLATKWGSQRSHMSCLTPECIYEGCPSTFCLFPSLGFPPLYPTVHWVFKRMG